MKTQASSESYASIYKTKIHETFMVILRDFLDRGKVPDYQELELLTLERLGLSNYVTPKIDYLVSTFDMITNISFLKRFLDRCDIDEIVVHNSNNIQLLKGPLKTYEHILGINREIYLLSLEVLVLKHGVTWNFSNPFASFYAKIRNEQYRVSLCHSCITNSNWPKAFIRKIRKGAYPLENYTKCISNKTFIERLVKNRSNILIAGATGSGKTSVIKSLLKSTSSNDHIVILEDTHEIELDHMGVTNLIAGRGEEKSLKAYLGHAMRMTPDRIILGEMRTAEVIPFILAMNTGHKGLMSTIHANSASDALHRLALLFSIYSTGQEIGYGMIMELICRNIDYVIYLEDRDIKEIIEVVGQSRGVPTYKSALVKEEFKFSA